MKAEPGKVAIKICGVTNVDDALLCAELGVDMLGLNFSPRSKRCIGIDQARIIVAETRRRGDDVDFVGVFVDQSRDFVQRVADEVSLDAVQLHGDESPEFVRSIRVPFVIKTIRVTDALPIANADAYDCDAILLDTWSATAPGGTGETFPWSVAAATRPSVRRLILAGGLTPHNVETAITAVQPFAVDVCSGVEDVAGGKSVEKLTRFVAAVRAAKFAKA